jgi:hypothetical protein
MMYESIGDTETLPQEKKCWNLNYLPNYTNEDTPLAKVPS